jgi:hypothetical protein
MCDDDVDVVKILRSGQTGHIALSQTTFHKAKSFTQYYLEG